MSEKSENIQKQIFTIDENAAKITLTVPSVSTRFVAYDEKNQEKWFCSENNNCLPPYNDKRLNAELSVFAGNIYQLVLQDGHPTYFVLSDGEKYYRGSKEIDNFMSWKNAVKFDEQAETFTIFGFPYVKGTSCVNVNNELWPLKNFIALLIVSSFLADADMHLDNLAIIMDTANKRFLCVKLDPGETFVNKFFFDQTVEDVEKTLDDLIKNHLSNAVNENQLIDGLKFYMPLVQDILNSPKAKIEKIQTLTSIFKMNTDEIIKLSNCISNTKYKEIYTKAVLENHLNYDPAEFGFKVQPTPAFFASGKAIPSSTEEKIIKKRKIDDESKKESTKQQQKPKK